MPLTLILLAGAIALLVLIPTRRLFLAGLSSTVLAAYFLFMLGLGLLVAELRGPARFLIPIFVIAYIAPFVTARDGIARIRGRIGGGTPGGSGRPDDGPRPPPRNVTPPEERPAKDRAR